MNFMNKNNQQPTIQPQQAAPYPAAQAQTAPQPMAQAAAQPQAAGLDALRNVVDKAKQATERDYFKWSDVATNTLFISFAGGEFLQKSVEKYGKTFNFTNYAVMGGVLVDENMEIVRVAKPKQHRYNLFGNDKLNEKIQAAIAEGYTHAILHSYEKIKTRAGSDFNKVELTPASATVNPEIVNFYETNVKA